MKYHTHFSCLEILASGFCLLGLLQAAHSAGSKDETPESLPVEFKMPQHPFIMLSLEEKAAAASKIKREPWAKAAMQKLIKDADTIVADPNFFPEKEGGWIHQYIDPKTGEELQFDPKKPHEHYSPESKTYCKGAILDAAWNSYCIDLTAKHQETLAATYLLTGNRKYAEAMKRVFLDMAEKYSKYRLHDKSMNFATTDAPTGGYATAQSIDECNYFTSLAISYDTLVGSGVLSKQEEEAIATKMWKPMLAYLDRLIELHPSGGNWTVWHACGAIVLGITFGDQALVSKGLNAPKYGILAMIRSGYINNDGFTGELSPRYQLYPFKGLMRMAMAARSVGINFYQIPQFKKMFDLPLLITYPNFKLPRLNDGDQISLTTDEWISIYEIAAHWYDNPSYGQLLRAIYSTPGSEIKRESPSALLYGPVALSGGTLDRSTSSFLLATGLSILRSPFSDWNCLLKNDKGSSGHRHPDALNLILYANGDEAFPGTGSPFYGNPTHEQWFTQTIAHNTVTLNTQSQRISPKGKTVDFGLSQWGLSAAQSSAGSVQGEKVEGECPALLRRTLVMTPHAIVDVYRVAKDDAAAKNAQVPSMVNQIDWTLHMNGAVTTDQPWRNSSDMLISSERMQAPINGKRWPHQGYKYIHDLTEPTQPGAIHGTLSQTSGGNVDFWLPPTPDQGKVYLANGVGLEHSIEKPMPILIQRRTANDTVFTSVYAPYKGKSAVQSVQFLTLSFDKPEAAVEITHADGKDLVLSHPGAGVLEIAGASLIGTLGCRAQISGGGELLLLVGQSWKDEKRELSLTQSGKVVVEDTSNGLSIYNASDSPVEGKLKIKARNIEKAFVIPQWQTISLQAKTSP